ncbi:hypothetical protein D9M72_468550 [compost metagenome]
MCERRSPRRTFAENIHVLAGLHQRRTQSQARALHALGHALGGEAAARLANVLGLRTSADTVLRELRRAPGRKRKPRPRVVGIDDWAIARGHQYGTIIVDLERREPIAVFAGREATAVTAWMRAHSSIEIVARDRAGALLRGGRHFAAGSQASLRSLASAVQPARQRREAAVPTRAATAPSRAASRGRWRDPGPAGGAEPQLTVVMAAPERSATCHAAGAVRAGDGPTCPGRHDERNRARALN